MAGVAIFSTLSSRSRNYLAVTTTHYSSALLFRTIHQQHPNNSINAVLQRGCCRLAVCKCDRVSSSTVISGASILTKQSGASALSHIRGFTSFVDLIRNQQVLKDSDEECRKVLADPSSRFVAYHKGKPLVSHDGYDPVLLTREQVEPHINGGLEDNAVWLKTNTDDGSVTFAVSLADSVDESQFPGKFTNLRLAMLFLGSTAPMLSAGSSLLRWHRVTKFCAACGSSGVKKSVSGNRMTCPDCGAVYYPPTSPVGISLVSSPDHARVLLQRQPMYPKGMYSCIAGFVDVGETLFDCLKREVAEEGGVELLPDSPCEIISSQHWPFPAGSLMMGCMVYADPAATRPSKDDISGEIEDVAWFTASQVRSALDFIDTNPKMRLEGSRDGSLFVPPKGTIANQMLTAWIKKYHKDISVSTRFRFD